MKLKIIVSLIFLCSANLWANGKTKVDKGILIQQEIPDPTKKMFVFILMGQSNMSGYGEMLTCDSIPVKGVFYIPTVTKTPYIWKPAAHPLHNRLSSDRFGLGIPFAKEYIKMNPNVEIGLLPLGWGGAGIDMLKKGTPVYDDFISKIKSVMQNKNVVVKGVLWHQGESDTVTEELAKSYESKLHKLILDIRQDVEIDNLPFVAGNLAEFYGTGPDHNKPERVVLINIVKQALRDLPSRVNNCGFVESTGCSSIDKHMVHFDRESYITLGTRYAKAIMMLK